MDFYILDDLYRREEVIDNFVSLIWAERYNDVGDFELVVHNTLRMRNLLVENTQVTVTGSRRFAIIQTITKKDGADGARYLTVKGSMAEAILVDRPARPSRSNSTVAPTWAITGLPADIAYTVFHKIMVEGVLSVDDKLPQFAEGSAYAAGNIALPAESLTLEIPPDSVLNAVKQICDMYNLGFRFSFNPYSVAPNIYFDIYVGSNRTAGQTTLDPVIFSQNLNNLEDVSELNSVEGYKNVAHVVSPNGVRDVLGVLPDSIRSGWDRHVLYVDASDITLAAGPDLDAALDQRGLEELAKYRSTSAMDGQLPETSDYVYEVHYFLGDLVEMRNEDGVANIMRVTEHIRVEDEQGYRAYPTLVSSQFITPGSWKAFEWNVDWVNAEGEWGTV